jgi:hypothetical protein
MPADSRGIKQRNRALQRGEASAFGIPLIPADERAQASNGYEAVYLRPDSPMAIVDGAFAIGGFIAFVGLLLSALSDHIYKSKD